MEHGSIAGEQRERRFRGELLRSPLNFILSNIPHSQLSTPVVGFKAMTTAHISSFKACLIDLHREVQDTYLAAYQSMLVSA